MIKKNSLILLNICVSVPTLLYHDAIGAFLPSVSARLIYIKHTGELSRSVLDQVPGFYSLGSTITFITGISPDVLIYTPIQIIPMVIILFLLIYELSESELIAGIASLIVLISSSQGSLVLFYQHGTGLLMLLVSWYAILRYLKTGDWRYIIVITSLAAPLIYYSYNNSAKISLTVVFVSFLLYAAIFLDIEPKNRPSPSHLLLAGLVIFTTIFSSWWVYRTMLPQLLAGIESKAGIEIFLTTFFKTEPSQNPVIGEIVLRRPSVVTYLGILKYVFLSIGIILFSLNLFRSKNNHMRISPAQIFIISLLGMSGFYFISRLLVSQVQFAIIFYPGIITLAWLSNNTEAEISKKMVFVSFSCILLLSVGIVGIQLDNNLINKDADQNQHIEPTAIWYDKYVTGTAETDVKTRFLFTLYITEYRFQIGGRPSVDEIIENEVSPMGVSGYPASLYGKSDYLPNYVILDMSASSLSLQSWLVVEPWAVQQERIEADRYHTIYDSGDYMMKKLN